MFLYNPGEKGESKLKVLKLQGITKGRNLLLTSVKSFQQTPFSFSRLINCCLNLFRAIGFNELEWGETLPCWQVVAVWCQSDVRLVRLFRWIVTVNDGWHQNDDDLEREDPLFKRAFAIEKESTLSSSTHRSVKQSRHLWYGRLWSNLFNYFSKSLTLEE